MGIGKEFWGPVEKNRKQKDLEAEEIPGRKSELFLRISLS
jgi:hypothetical protein